MFDSFEDVGVKVRSRWVAMIESPLPERKRDYWRTIFNAVVPDDNNGETDYNPRPELIPLKLSVVMKTPANLRYPKFGEDLRLGLRYSRAMQLLTRDDKQTGQNLEKSLRL